MLINRRRFLKGIGAFGLGSLALGSYAVAIEPGYMLDVTPYDLTAANWPAGLRLRITIVADIHACEPFMSAARIRTICEVANATNPDLIVMLGDFNGGHNYVTGPVMPDQWAEAISILRAPLGVFAILGNHDWWHGALPRMRGDDAEGVRVGLAAAGVRLLENEAVRLSRGSQGFWLLGLGDQIARRVRRNYYTGVDDLDGTLAQVKDDAPAILLAHEPNIFYRVPKRVALTLCGHTHGGQVSFPIIGSPLAERRFGKTHVYGHLLEDDRHLIISAGLGTSFLPVRFGRPPELTIVDIGSAAIA